MYNKLVILVIILLIFIFTNVEHFTYYFNLSNHCEGIITKNICCGAYGNQCKWNNSTNRCYNCNDNTNLQNNCSNGCY